MTGSQLAAFFNDDPESVGSKGLIYIGDKVVVYRRDTKTDNHPLQLDLPGGTSERGETPFQTFQREVREEVHLNIQPESVVYCVRCPHDLQPDKFFYFAVAKLPAAMEAQVKLGNEGKDLRLMAPADFAAAADAWPILAGLAQAYLQQA